MTHPQHPTNVPVPPQPVDNPPAVAFENQYRTAHNRWWMGLVGIIAVVVVFFVAGAVGGIIAVLIDLATGAVTQEELSGGTLKNTPLVLLFGVNLPLILGGATAWLAHRVIHGQPWSRMFSVVPRIRWKWWGLSAVCIVPLFAVYVVISTFATPEAAQGSTSPFTFDGTAIAFLFIIILTTPLQAASEEMMFRSYIPRVISSWIPRVGSIIGVLVATVLFTLAHGAADPWLWAYYAVFGLAMAVLTHFSGGIEGGIVLHGVNNVVMFTIALFAGQMSDAFDRSEGTGGPFMIIPMIAILVIAVVTALVARWRKIPMTGPVHVKKVKQPVAYPQGGQPPYTPGAQQPPQSPAGPPAYPGA